MSKIRNLEIDLDLKENLLVTATCKQLDNLNLIFNIWDNGLQIDLNNYDAELRALKNDKVPLIQNTDIVTVGNTLTIKADEQLTTTSGITECEIKFTDKVTYDKKLSFNLNLKVVKSVLEVNRSISTPTLTLLEKLENTIDTVKNIGDTVDAAKKTKTDLEASNATANITKTNLENTTTNADTKKQEVNTVISNAADKIADVERSITNADNSKKALDAANTLAATNTNNLDVANVQAVKNYDALNQLGDATNLAKKVQENTAQLSEIALVCPKATGDLTTDTTNLQNAINSASSGDKINISGNYYISNIVFKNNITFIGNNGATFTIKYMLEMQGYIHLKFYNITFTYKVEDNDESKPLVHLYQSHNFYFDNCTFSNSLVTSRTLLYGARTYYGRFNNCHFNGIWTSASNGCKIYDGTACELVLFNSNIFNNCTFGKLARGIKVTNTQFLVIHGCNFEHLNTESVGVYASNNASDSDTALNSNDTDSIIIESCYFETAWTTAIDTVTYSYSTEWIDNCRFVYFGERTMSCKLTDSYFEVPRFDLRDGRTFKFQSVVNKGYGNIINNVGWPRDANTISNNASITLLNSNSDLSIKDNNGIPLGVSLDDNVVVTNVDGRVYSVNTNKAGTGIHYLFSPNKSTDFSCILLKLKSNNELNIEFKRIQWQGMQTSIDIPLVDDVFEFSYDDRILGIDSKLLKNYIYCVSITTKKDLDTIISLDYIKVLDARRPLAIQYKAPSVAKSAFRLSSEYKLNDNYILKDKFNDILLIDSLNNQLNLQDAFSSFKSNNIVRNLYEQEMFSTPDSNVNRSYNNTTKETTMTISNASLTPNRYGLETNMVIPDGLFKEQDGCYATFYLEVKVVNKTGSFGAKLGLISNLISDNSGYSGNYIVDIDNQYYIPLTLKMYIPKNTLKSIRITIMCNVNNQGDTGSVVFRNACLSFEGNPNLNTTISQAPTTGFFKAGDKYLKSNISDGYIGYICTTTGNPGVWNPYGLIKQQ